MHAKPAVTEQNDDTQSQTQSESAEPEVVTSVFGNIMDVLMPANPPEPKNARIVRQFDLEAAKTDSQPTAESAAPTRRPQHERRTREEARAFRNRSLRAAAGLD